MPGYQIHKFIVSQNSRQLFSLLHFFTPIGTMEESTSTETTTTTEDSTPRERKTSILLTVKFETENFNILTQSFPRDTTISNIKRNLEQLLMVPSEKLVLLHNQDIVPEGQKLEILKPDLYGILQLRILTNDDNFKIDVLNVYKDLVIPDILTVHLETEKEGEKDVVVEIENRAIEKPNLGGYRHITTGVKYLHGYTQTGPPKSKVSSEMKNHRDTQTYFTRNRRTEMEYSKATQVATKDIYIPSISDKILTSGPYETADEREKRLDVIGKVRTIQR